MRGSKNEKRCRMAFVLYAALMIWLLFLQRINSHPVVPVPYLTQLKWSYNLVPFRTISQMLHSGYNQTAAGEVWRLPVYAFVNLVGNVVMFIPLGFFLPALWPRFRAFKRFLVWHTGMLLVIEVIQVFTLLGSFDVDDLILNTAGSVIGFFGYRFLDWWRNRTEI